jgi:ethanolamine utilization microcompartment shell protein EutL
VVTATKLIAEIDMCDYDLVKNVVDKLYAKYGTYAHATGYLQSTVAGLLSGNDNPADVRRRLNNMLVELESENG